MGQGGFSTASTWRWGLKSGPKREGVSPAAAPAQRAVPGEFVSDELRDDCARFLHDMRTLIGHRRELSPERRDAWVPGQR